MPFQLIAPIQKEMRLEKTDKFFSQFAEVPTFATFMQAPTGASERRQDRRAALLEERIRKDMHAGVTAFLNGINRRDIHDYEAAFHELFEAMLSLSASYGGVTPEEERAIVRYSRLAREDVFNTLIDCNLTDEDGETPLFKFKNGRLTTSRAEFDRIWEALPPIVTEELHDLCLTVNPDWDWRKRDSDDTPISGEDGSGESSAN